MREELSHSHRAWSCAAVALCLAVPTPPSGAEVGPPGCQCVSVPVVAACSLPQLLLPAAATLSHCLCLPPASGGGVGVCTCECVLV